MDIGVFNILRRRYPATEFTLLAEVSNAAGFERSRSCDFMLMSLWPSRGLPLSGFELKKSRSDWLSELKKAAKAEAFYKYCDYWWLLTVHNPGMTIAKLEEIPEPWGWMEIKGEKCHIMKEAPRNMAPVEMSRGFLAALLKRAADRDGWILRNEIQNEIVLAKENAVYHLKAELEHEKDDHRALQTRVREFEHASGIQISYRWDKDTSKMGQALRILMDGGSEKLRQELISLETTAKNIHERISHTIKLMPAKPDGEGK